MDIINTPETTFTNAPEAPLNIFSLDELLRLIKNQSTFYHLRIILNREALTQEQLNTLAACLHGISQIYKLELFIKPKMFQLRVDIVFAELKQIPALTSLTIQLGQFVLSSGDLKVLKRAVSQLVHLKEFTLKIDECRTTFIGDKYLTQTIGKFSELTHLSLHLGSYLYQPNLQRLFKSITKQASLQLIEIRLYNVYSNYTSLQHFAYRLSRFNHLRGLILQIPECRGLSSEFSRLEKTLIGASLISQLGLKVDSKTPENQDFLIEMKEEKPRRQEVQQFDQQEWFPREDVVGEDDEDDEDSSKGNSEQAKLLKVFNQLHKFDEISIDLSDYRLGLEESEALSESLLNLNQLKTLQIRYPVLGPSNQNQRQIMEPLASLPILSSLDLNIPRKNEDSIHIEQVMKTLSLLKCLTELRIDISSNSIGLLEVQGLMKTIADLPILSSLHINLGYNKLKNLVCDSLVGQQTGFKNLTSLSLNLDCNEICDSDCEPLGKSLSRLTNLTTLELSLQKNNIGDLGCKFLSQHLSQLINVTKFNLNLSQNDVGGVGSQKLGELLSNLKALTSVELNLIQNNIGEMGYELLGDSLIKLTKLQKLELSLSQNDISKMLPTRIFKPPTQPSSLLALKIQLYNNKIGSDECAKFAKLLVVHTKITTLEVDLRINQIGDAGCIELANSLTQLIELKSLRLILSRNKISDAGAESLCQAINKLNDDVAVYLNISDNSDIKIKIMNILRKVNLEVIQ